MFNDEIPLDKLRQSARNFNRLESVEQLSVKWDRTPQYDFQNNVDAFKSVLKSYPGGVSHNPDLERDIELIELNTPGYKYNPDDQYYSSNVCFQTIDNMASAHTKLKNPKVNTHILCPFCDPFAESRKLNSHRETKKTTIGGKTHHLPRAAPIHSFYNTLGTKYVHHMSGSHGLRKNGEAEEPILGFVGSEMDFYIICPNVTNGEPCLAMAKFFGTKRMSEPGFKGYYRHYGSCHLCSGENNLKKYSRRDLFVPLDLDNCMKATKGHAREWFRFSLNQQAQMIIDSALSSLEVNESDATKCRSYEHTPSHSAPSYSTRDEDFRPDNIHHQEFLGSLNQSLVTVEDLDLILSGDQINALQTITNHYRSSSVHGVPELEYDSTEIVDMKSPVETVYQQHIEPYNVTPSHLCVLPEHIDPWFKELILSTAVDESTMAFPTMH